MDYIKKIFVFLIVTTITANSELKINIYPALHYTQNIDVNNTNHNSALAQQPLPTMQHTAMQSSGDPMTELLTRRISGAWKVNHFLQLLYSKKSLISAAIGAISGYASLLAYLITRSRAIKNSDRWDSWKQEVPVAALHELPITQVANVLRDALHKKYNKAEPRELVSALADIEAEKNQLERLIFYSSLIKTCKLSLLFWYRDSVEELAKNKLKRLEFIREFLITHMVKIVEGQPSDALANAA